LSLKVLHESKDDFLTFVRQMAPMLVSDFKMGKHIEVIAEKLRKLEAGEIKRLMVFLPPRSSKSVICSKLFPAWYIGRNPEHEILTVSHSDQLSSDFGRSVRDIVNTEEFQDVFKGVSLRSDVSTMLQELDPRLQEEVHILRSLMMSCQKKTHTLKQVEDMLRNGTQQD
jgi:hypothetical protein